MISSNEVSSEILQLERDGLDQRKEEFNDAHHALHNFLDNEEEKEALYRWFDIQDRECMDCRIRLAERIHATERAKAKSVSSGTSKTSRKTGSFRSSADSVLSRRVQAATRNAKLEVEMKFLQQEFELRRLQLMKDISSANAEEEAIKGILEEGKGKSISDRKLISEMEGKENKKDVVKGCQFNCVALCLLNLLNVPDRPQQRVCRSNIR